MSTLLVSGGHLVSENGVRRANLLAANGQVQAILDPEIPIDADEVLVADGLHVLPGVVDAHVHFNEPGRTDWEGFRTGTTAAAAGGITTVCEMPLNSHPATVDVRALALKRSAVAEEAVVDYALWGGLIPGSLAHAAELQRGGVIGLKAFLCDSGLADYPHLDEFELLEAMQLCAELGLLLAVHAEDPVETRRLADAARAAGRSGALDWAQSRPPSTEVDAVRRALEAGRATDVRLHFVHISTSAAARLITAAREAGQDVSVETCPHYLAFDEADLQRLGGLGKCAPPLRARPEVDALWAALLDGALDWIASDHSPCPPHLKEASDIWSVWGGLGGIQSLLPSVLTEGVARRGMSLPRVVTLTSGAPARRLKLFPRKGSLDIGADADLVLVDLDANWTLDRDALRTRWRGDPFVGRSFTGRVAATVVRGTVVWRAGALQVSPGYGQPVRPAA